MGGVLTRGSGCPPPSSFFTPPPFFPTPLRRLLPALLFEAGVSYSGGCPRRRTTKRKRPGCRTRCPSPTQTASSSLRGAMRQRILRSHTTPCHRRMVITTQFIVSPCCTAALTSSVPLQVVCDCAWAACTSGSTRTHHPPTVPVSLCGAMRQRILGSHTPPCHRRMVITTSFSVFHRCSAAQTISVPLQVAAHCALALAICTSRSPRTHHPPTMPVSL